MQAQAHTDSGQPSRGKIKHDHPERNRPILPQVKYHAFLELFVAKMCEKPVLGVRR
jgi:hypothetical protein